MKNLFISIFIVSLFFPLISLAGTYTTAGGVTVTYTGLVPCGKHQAGPGESSQVTAPCQFCHFFVMFKAILDLALKLVVAIAVLMFVYSGFLFFFGAGILGMPDTISKAKSTLFSTVWGLIIIFAAWVIVGTIFVFLGLSTFGLGLTGPDKWFTISCPVILP